MDLLTIMINIARFFKNKFHLSLSKGYKIKVDKNSYILFKKEEDYEILFYLERVFFDLFKKLLFNDDEIIRVFFRLSLVKIYLEKLPEIKIKIFYDKRKYQNPIRIKFPNLSYFDYYEEIGDEIQEKINEFYKDIGYIYSDVEYKINEKINIKYYKL